MTPGPTMPPVISVEAPLYAIDPPIIPVLLAIALLVGLVLLLRRRRGDRPTLGGE